jgi:hypothetical protein
MRHQEVLAARIKNLEESIALLTQAMSKTRRNMTVASFIVDHENAFLGKLQKAQKEGIALQAAKSVSSKQVEQFEKQCADFNLETLRLLAALEKKAKQQTAQSVQMMRTEAVVKDMPKPQKLKGQATMEIDSLLNDLIKQTGLDNKDNPLADPESSNQRRNASPSKNNETTLTAFNATHHHNQPASPATSSVAISSDSEGDGEGETGHNGKHASMH